MSEDSSPIQAEKRETIPRYKKFREYCTNANISKLRLEHTDPSEKIRAFTINLKGLYFQERQNLKATCSE